MVRRLGAVAAALCVVLAACDEPSTSTVQEGGPSLANQPTGQFACVFTGNPSLSNAANAYFSVSTDRKMAQDTIAAMQTAFGSTKNYQGARDPGWSLLALTGNVSRRGTGNSAAAGATLVQQAIQCMFDVKAGLADDFTGWPTDPQFDFASALTPATGGAFYVRGGTSDGSGPAIGNNAGLVPTGGLSQDGNVSGFAPGGNATTWNSLLGGGRALIYGQPVTGGFDWKIIPRNTTFNPYAVVALCPAARPGQDFTSSEMILQQGVGVVGYVDGSGICSTEPSITLLESRSAFALLHAFAQKANQWLTPEPLQATTLLTTLGGTTTKAKGDEFVAQDVPNVKLTFTTNPPANIKANTGRFSVTVNVSTPPTPVGGIRVSLSATNNNGTFKEMLQGLPTGGCTQADGATTILSKVTLSTVSTDGTSQPTSVTWNNLCFSGTGAAIVVANSSADSRTGGKGTALSTKTNVKP